MEGEDAYVVRLKSLHCCGVNETSWTAADIDGARKLLASFVPMLASDS